MRKKICLMIALGLGVINITSAQSFTVTANPVDSTTTGTAILQPEDETYPELIDMVTQVKNISNTAFSIKWQFVSEEAPTGWHITGVCDNILCRSDSGTWWSLHEEQTSNPIEPGTNGLMEARVYAPTSAPDGIGIYKVRVSTFGQIDTIVYRLTKTAATGVSVIKMDDERVSLYPNPATNILQVYADKNLNPAQIAIFNITGIKSMHTAVAKGKEITDVNIDALAKGIYLVRISDEQGKLITTRKFSKK